MVSGLLAVATGCTSAPTPTLPTDAAVAPDDGSPPVDAPGTTAPVDAAGTSTGMARVGAHVLAYTRTYTGQATVITAPITTQATGSTIVVSTGRGVVAAAVAPTDSRGNRYDQLGATHTYALWPTSGTSVYAAVGVQGGAGHTVSATKPVDDEITLAAVEIVAGGTIQDAVWREVRAGSPLTSRTVTTTGRATLVAFWWGDAGIRDDKTAVPDNGFTVVDSILLSGELVQCAVATREVATAGTYDVTWVATPVQGAQLWLIAVQ